MRSVGTALVLLLAVGPLAACAESTRAATVPPSVSVATANPAAVVAPTTTMLPPPTIPASSTTGLNTSTTLVDRAALEEDVKQAAIRQIMVDNRACLLSPDRCDVDAITPSTGTARATLLATVTERRHLGWRSKPNATDPSSLVVTAVTMATEGRSAVVQTCLWNTNIVYEPNAAPDGSDIIVNDAKASYNIRYEMVPEHGVWLIANATLISRTPGENLCAARR